MGATRQAQRKVNYDAESFGELQRGTPESFVAHPAEARPRVAGADFAA
jgi:hypothetical protein